MATEIVGRAQQVGLVMAAAAVPGTFERSLSDRTWIDQGLITGLATGTHFLLSVMTQDAIDTAGVALSTALPLPTRWSDTQRADVMTLALDLAAIPLGLAAFRLVKREEHETWPRGIARQSAWRLWVTGLGGAILVGSTAAARVVDHRLGANGKIARLPVAIPVAIGVDLALERLSQRAWPAEHRTDPAGRGPLLGLAAGTGVVLVLAGGTAAESWAARQLGSIGYRVLPISEDLWRRAGHVVALGAAAAITSMLWNRAMGGIESGTSQFDEGMDESVPGLWTTPMVSGHPESLVPWASMGREGRRHVATSVRPVPFGDGPTALHGVPRPELSIRTVMEEDARAVPISVFVGLDTAPTATERVDIALAEMDRTDAWSRSLLMLISPTGTGYVNYVAMAAAQYMTRGDMASITLQYSKRPSPLSLGKIGDAREQNRLLWLRILERVRAMAPEDRPRVVVFGESLGAHTSQAAFEGWGTLGPEALGIDRALWIGTPAASKWRREVTGADRPDVDRALVCEVNDYEEFRALGDAREKVRYCLLNHDNDGVTKFGPSLLAHRPSWLNPGRPAIEEVPGRSPRGVPASMRWRSGTTFFQLLIDMKNAQIPGSYRAWAHDYRPDLPEFIRDIFGLECSDEQLERIKVACEQREEFREAVFS
ncbi:MAG: alpha/beta-hydrolase family protein [Actinobacteria bacterium]|nr:alpha/beta-hydrolase family protein [Actinomycetota bacterium]